MRGGGYDAGVRRKLFPVCSAASLLLCAAVGVMWVATLGRQTFQILDVGREPNRYVARAQNGVLTLSGQPLKGDLVANRVRSHGRVILVDDYLVAIPLWLLALAFGVLPAAAAFHSRKRRLSNGGLCPACGYDLRATPDRCPECGAEGRVRACAAG